MDESFAGKTHMLKKSTAQQCAAQMAGSRMKQTIKELLKADDFNHLLQSLIEQSRKEYGLLAPKTKL
jgi:hypothetical protein